MYGGLGGIGAGKPTGIIGSYCRLMGQIDTARRGRIGIGTGVGWGRRPYRKLDTLRWYVRYVYAYSP